MSRNKLFRGFAIALALAVSLPALAASRHKKDDPKPLAKSTFALVGNELLGNTALKAGEYVVTAEESKISFWRNDKLVAEAPVIWKQLNEVPQRNTVVIDSGKIIEVRFPGKNRSAWIE